MKKKMVYIKKVKIMNEFILKKGNKTHTISYDILENNCFNINTKVYHKDIRIREILKLLYTHTYNISLKKGHGLFRMCENRLCINTNHLLNVRYGYNYPYDGFKYSQSYKTINIDQDLIDYIMVMLNRYTIHDVKEMLNIDLYQIINCLNIKKYYNLNNNT